MSADGTWFPRGSHVVPGTGWEHATVVPASGVPPIGGYPTGNLVGAGVGYDDPNERGSRLDAVPETNRVPPRPGQLGRISRLVNAPLPSVTELRFDTPELIEPCPRRASPKHPRRR